jgi:hypothetical protein
LCGTGATPPWLLRKTPFLARLPELPKRSLLVIAADKAHTAGDMALDGRHDAGIWRRLSDGIEESAWYLLRLQQQLSRRLPESRLMERLGEAVSEILGSAAYQRIVPRSFASAVWAAGYGERHQVAEES